MNKQEQDILMLLRQEAFINQRLLAESSGYSLGVVNRSLKHLLQEGYLDEENQLTEKSHQEFINHKPKNAIILAAGFGMRMAPINMDTPKGLLEVGQETLIERLIRQLQEVGIYEIYVVVGFMKEQYEYLIDTYGIQLVVNEEYARKNNLHSLNLVADHLSDSYIIPCDLWAEKNPFREVELYSWYMVSEGIDPDSSFRVNRKEQIVNLSEKGEGHTEIGIAYLTEADAKIVREKLNQFDQNRRYNGAFWEEVLYEKDRMIVKARMVGAKEVIEINTYAQLKEMRYHSDELGSTAIQMICQELKTKPDRIREVKLVKKGVTNHSFSFQVGEERYVIRIPNPEVEVLIDRVRELQTYACICGENLSEEVLALDEKTGYKIAHFLEEYHPCDPHNSEEVKKCMATLREVHQRKWKVAHVYDIFAKIDFYESLWEGHTSVYRDYEQTKSNVLSLRPYIEAYQSEQVLTHVDAVPDNFMISPKGEVRLIDWEYAGMQDPHMDVAMFGIYAMYEREEMEWLIDTYFEGQCPDEIRTKIYCYVAVCGLLWSNWCEYNRNTGIDFGAYSLKQYRYAKEYYRIVQERLQEDKRNE